MNRATRSILAAAAVAAFPWLCRAADARPAIVSHVKVVSDKTEDVTSLDAWRMSVIKEGMSDQQKAMAVWQSVVKFRHQENPPDEYLESANNVHDPIKSFNVYGYGMCCCASANVQALARAAGLEARGWGIIAHSVPEVKWGGSWHLLDASLITYFPKSDGQPAGVTEIAENVKQWYAANPKYKGNDDALRQYMRAGNWRTGPELLRSCPGYDENGWLPAATHGWYATMQEYADPAKTFLYEYGAAVGYEVNVQLRKGERLTRNWSNKGLHVNMAEGKSLGVINGKPGSGDLRYSPKLGDLAPGRVGNGTLEYDVPVASDELSRAAIEHKNLRTQDAALVTQDSAQPGVFVLDMPTSYVYLSGQADVKARMAAGGSIAIALSGNNGLDWTDVATINESGSKTVDLKPHVYRRYDYRLRFTLTGAGTKLESLKLTHDVQHSQRALPALDKGQNTITFSAGLQEGTVTVFGNTNKEAKGKNLMYTDFHPAANNIKSDMLFLAGGKGDITFPVATPGDLTRLRIGAHYRARDKRDNFDVAASFDDGKTWKPVGKLDGPYAGNSKAFTFADIPAGKRKALVRFAGVQFNTLGLHDLRVDADHAQPHGGFTPVKVTYVWAENGQERRDTHIAQSASETYTITCAEKPLLKSLIVERAD
jgi:hypothetical protein